MPCPPSTHQHHVWCTCEMSSPQDACPYVTCHFHMIRVSSVERTCHLIQISKCDSLSHSIRSECRVTVVCVAQRALYIAKRALHSAKRDVDHQMSCYCRVHCQKSPVHCQKRPVHCQKSPVPCPKSPTHSHFMHSESHSDSMLRITCHVHVHTVLQCVCCRTRSHTL